MSAIATLDSALTSKLGCSTCLLSHKGCNRDKSNPSNTPCDHCLRLGLSDTCISGTPSWWFSPKTKEEEAAKIKAKLASQKKRPELKKYLRDSIDSQGSSDINEFDDCLPTLTNSEGSVSACASSQDLLYEKDASTYPSKVSFLSSQDGFPMRDTPQTTNVPSCGYSLTASMWYDLDIAALYSYWTRLDNEIDPLAHPVEFCMDPEFNLSAGDHNLHKADNISIPDCSLSIGSFHQSGDTALNVADTFATVEHRVAKLLPDNERLDEYISRQLLREIFPILTLDWDHISSFIQRQYSYWRWFLLIAAERLGAPETIGFDVADCRSVLFKDLGEELKRNVNPGRSLEIVLGLFIYLSNAERPMDIRDMRWYRHICSAFYLIQQACPANSLGVDYQPTTNISPLTRSLFFWIDILSATMRGTAPLLADIYRELRQYKSPSGLSQLTGCNDDSMYLISEVACLEHSKISQRINDKELCAHIRDLNLAIEQQELSLGHGGNETPSTRAVTALFLKAARVYLLMLVPDQAQVRSHTAMVLQGFSDSLDQVSASVSDTCLIWPLLVAGSQCANDSELRAKLQRRKAAAGVLNENGRLCRMYKFLEEVWATDGVHWRDRLRDMNWPIF